jgi:hypothetical protein
MPVYASLPLSLSRLPSLLVVVLGTGYLFCLLLRLYLLC